MFERQGRGNASASRSERMPERTYRRLLPCLPWIDAQLITDSCQAILNALKIASHLHSSCADVPGLETLAGTHHRLLSACCVYICRSSAGVTVCKYNFIMYQNVDVVEAPHHRLVN